MEEKVILVNERDEQLGTMEKMEAHRKGVLHRAFSVFVFNTKGEMLLQRRALSKYHSAGLWTNTCCSHPRPGESTEAAAYRRLKEEMGMWMPLNYKTHFIYRAEFTNNLVEHELDHIFEGYSDAVPAINHEEVMEFRWEDIDGIRQEIKNHPELFTEWFKIALKNLY